MKCKICNHNEANIVFTQIIDNQKIVHQICSECARKKGVSIEFKKPAVPKKTPSLGTLSVQIGQPAGGTDTPNLVCSSCGLTFAEFKRDGLFGCDRCHIAFGEYVPTLLKQIHGAGLHAGKLPGEQSEETKRLRELNNLKKELHHCIECEEYERAAELRDMIANIEGNM
jgi:protein arginine kinase activator